jgi:primase-polymerase (primpol)-like protein
MTCAHCSSSLPVLQRGDARFCSTRCRVAAHRSLPAEQLRIVDRWVRYSPTKVPLTAAGDNASSTNSSTWCDFDTAARSSAGVGVGFVLSDVDRIACVDIDHCLDGRGRLRSWATDILANVPDTYIEVSPSGDGLHVWGLADIAKGRRSGGVEVYGSGRYITVTSQRWRKCGTAFADLNEWIGSLPI